MNDRTNASEERAAGAERVADALRLDGNAAAGLLSEIFVPDVTAARATCAHCGVDRPVGALLLYAHGMGVVVRCPSCDGVVLRATRTSARVWLDLTGATRIGIPIAAPPA
ncbi:MAG TPA: DUF6510 family protein [Gemmatimonadaceae bacterium]